MKFTAAILAALTLFLTAQEPMLTLRWDIAAEAIPPEETSCSPVTSSCKKQNPVNPAEEKPGNCCDTNFCNPFGACCPFMPIERPFISPGSSLLAARIKILVDDNSLSSYVPDVWNPPKEKSLSLNSNLFLI